MKRADRETTVGDGVPGEDRGEVKGGMGQLFHVPFESTLLVGCC